MKQLIFIIFLLISLSLQGATYYVSTTGSNSNSGTIGSPWLTWQYGFDQANAGDIVYIRGGTYAMTGTLSTQAVNFNNNDGTGTNLGIGYNVGLDESTSWTSSIVTKSQGTYWSIGAFIPSTTISLGKQVKQSGKVIMQNGKIIKQ